MFPHILVFLSLLFPSLASLTPMSTTSSTLLMFGTAHTTQTYLLETPNRITSVTIDAPTKSFRPILSNFSSSSSAIREGVYNITLDMFFEDWVGNFDYAVMVDTISTDGVKQSFSHIATHKVYGLVVYRDNSIVSGDESSGVMFDHYLTDDDEGQEFSVMTYAPDGVDMTPSFTTRDTFSKGSTVVKEGVKLVNGMLTIRPRDFTTGSAVVDMVCNGLESGGEIYENVIMVSVGGANGPVVLREVRARMEGNESVVEGVIWNGGKKVELVIEGNKLEGKMVEKEIYKFDGMLKKGIYENIRIFSDGEEGIVKDGLVIEIMETRGNHIVAGKKNVGITFGVIIVVVISVVMAFGIAWWVTYRRSIKMKSMFIDGRPVHIVRDVYGRGSLHV